MQAPTGERSSLVQTQTQLDMARMDRKCTDWACGGCFAIYLIGMLVVMGIATGTGDPNRLIYGTDYMGSTCGGGPNEPSVREKLEANVGKTPKDVADTYWKEAGIASWSAYYQQRKAITYPRTNVDQLVSKLLGAKLDRDIPSLPNFYGLCVKDCPVARVEPKAGFVATEAEIRSTLHEDVVCSIQASKKIQPFCEDASFIKNLNNKTGLFSVTTGTPTPNKPYNLPNIPAGNGYVAGYGPKMVNISYADRKYELGNYLLAQNIWKLPWNPIPKKNDKNDNSYQRESMCLTQFYDRCSGFGKDNCKEAGASEEALLAVENDCWQQKVNSLNVINRCVASRNVEMEVICSDPVKTVSMQCRDRLHRLCYLDGNDISCASSVPAGKTLVSSKDKCEKRMFNGTLWKRMVDSKGNTIDPNWDGTFSNGLTQTKLACPKNDDGTSKKNAIGNEYTPYGTSDTCWSNEGVGQGKWLVTKYNNTGSKELTPEEVAGAIQSGDPSVSNPGYCSASTTVTKSIYGVKTNKLFEWLNNAGKVAAGWFADFQKTKTVILVSGIVLSMFLSFGWIWFMKNLAKCVCWTTLILSVMSVIALDLCLYVKAGIIGQDILGGIQGFVASKDPELADQIPNSFPDYLQPSETRKSLYKWSAMAMTVFILLTLIFMVKFRQKINVAIQMCKEAAQAILAMPLIVFWPFLNVILLVIVMVYFIFIAMFIASAANLQTVNVGLKEEFDNKMLQMKDATNYAIDKGNAAGASATEAYNKEVEKWNKEGFGPQDWNAVQHMHYNASTVQPLNFNANTAIRAMLAYHTVGMWWISLVIVTVGHYTVARAVSAWYFNAASFKKQSDNRAAGLYKEKANCGCCSISCREQRESPVYDACKQGCRFHVGSFAQGAALNILVVFLKFGFLWINKLVGMMTGRNSCARKIKACMFLLMGFFDKFVRIIGRNAYILMALRGEGFCKSAGWASWLIFAAQDNPKDITSGEKQMEEHAKARKAFNKKQKKKIQELKSLKPSDTATFTSISFVSGGEVSKEVKIMTEKAKERQIDHEDNKLTSYEGPYKKQSYNAAQYAVLSLITDILLFLGKMVVVVLCGIMAYSWVNAQFPVGTLTSSAAPIAVAMLFSFFIASAFMGVYEMSIDTILICFFYDKLQNKGGPYAMSPQLKKLVLANLPPGTNKSDMRKGDSFFFSNMVTRQGTIAIGAGWDAEQSQPTGSGGQKHSSQMASTTTYVNNPELDIDLAMCVFDRDAALLDYIGYMEAIKPSGESAMCLKNVTGGNLFADQPGKTMSNISVRACKWSGDDKNGNAAQQNIAGINEDITVRLHEMPINVDTLAFVMFSFKGPCFNEISDLRLYATECTVNDGGSGNRKPEVVAKFNCDFDKETLEGAQQALLCVTLRRNPGPKFPKGEVDWSEAQKNFARKFASEPITGTHVNYLKTKIDSNVSSLGISQQHYQRAKARVDAYYSDQYDQILESQKRSKKSGNGETRSLKKRIEAFEELVAADTIFNVLSEASQAQGCFLTPSQLMLWNRTFSPFNPGKKGTKYTQGCKPHGDMSTPEEDFFDCAWEIQAQRELMGMKKFNSSCINHIARKCFFFREAGDKFAKHTQPGGSYFGKAAASAAAFAVSA
jgi:ABC-type multidrug transport system fused ATPase/permease subunit